MWVAIVIAVLYLSILPFAFTVVFYEIRYGSYSKNFQRKDGGDARGN